jgi:hypothetical protein
MQEKEDAVLAEATLLELCSAWWDHATTRLLHPIADVG